MKLRGQIADAGVRLLDRELLPLLEKFGKTCIVLFRPDDVHFIQKAVDADGMQITARCVQTTFFEEGTYAIQSRYKNFIALGFDISLLRRVLSAACRNDAESLDMKLTMRGVPAGGGAAGGDFPTFAISDGFLPRDLQVLSAACRNGAESLDMKLTMRGVPTGGGAGGSGETVHKPFLSLVTTGGSISMAQDLPITKPHPPSQVDRLVRDLESEVCPWYLDLQPEMHDLQAIVDRMKPLGSGLVFGTTKAGAAHIQMGGPNVQLGAEFRNLDVLPAGVKTDAVDPAGATAEDRLREALRLGDASEVTVQLKHFQKCTASSNLMATQQLWCGIAAARGYVHMIFTFAPLGGDGGIGRKEGLELSYKMPVRDDG